ncbi:MAG: ABC transporter permease [Nocardioidaceae bacterium]|nr:ABC transporter permease [Nocardioidaceae bacterium]
MQELAAQAAPPPAPEEVEGPAVEIAPARGARLRGIARAAVRRPGVVLAVLVLLVAATAAFFPGLFTGTDPLATDPRSILLAPGADGHWLGTDAVGRDLFSRVVYGTRESLQAALLAMTISLVLGSLVGLAAGYLGGLVDTLLMRLVDVMLAFPALLLAMAVIAALGFGSVTVAIAVGVVGVAAMARLMRSEVLRVRTHAYVEAAALSGTRTPAILARHVLPNAAGPALVLAALDFGTAILAVSSLSFLGFGEPPPSPEWGALISAGRDYLATAWWLSAFPGMAIAAVVLSSNHVSRAISERVR